MYYDRTSLAGPQLGETRNTIDVDLVHHVAALPRQNLRWGAGMHWSPSRFEQVVPSLILDPQNETDSIYSAFVQDELAVIRDRLSLTMGVKLEHNNFTGGEVQPSVRLLWTPAAGQSLWGAVTRAVRTPSQLEEDVQLERFLIATPPTFLQLVGNPSFEVERVIGYEGGYRIGLGGRAFIDLSAFRNRHDGLQSFGQAFLVIAPTPLPAHRLFVLPYANGAAGTSDGFEIAPDWKVNNFTQVKASYSYLNVSVHNTTTVNDLLNVIPTYNGSSPHHQVVLQPILTLPRGWDLTQTYRYVSALPARATASYVTLDARLAWHMTPAVEVAVVGQNLLQDRHVEFGPSVMIKRAAYLSLTWRR
jgi:iron complex outermembrane receptor protein